MKKILIIGGMAAGCKAAARIKRLMPDADVKILEKGEIISFGACGMPFYASGDIDDFYELARTPFGIDRNPEFFLKAKNVEVLTKHLAEKIDRDTKKVIGKNIESNEQFEFEYDELIIATGASALKPPFDCPDSDKISTFHNPFDALKFRQKAQTGQIGSVIIIGGGFIGCELAESMVAMWGIETRLIERMDRLMPISIDKEISMFLEKNLKNNDIELMLKTTVKNISLDTEGNPVVLLDDGKEFSADHVFLCMGVRPEVSLAVDSGIEIGELGGIKVDKSLKTSADNIWAAGDCIQIENLISQKPCRLPLGSIANRQGRIIANNISGRKSVFKGGVGAISAKMFGQVVAAAGLTEEMAEKAGIEYGKVWGSYYDRPDYHPDSKSISGKLLYEKKTMRLIGIQLFGAGEVTRYVDTFSVLASNRADCYEMMEYEHAYTPPHSGPLNPLYFLAAQAINKEEENLNCLAPNFKPDKSWKIIDVREPDEMAVSPYHESAVVIPIVDFGSKINEFDKNEKYLIVCQKGPRSYEAARMMRNAGFKDVAYIAGGAQMANVMLDEVELM